MVLSFWSFGFGFLIGAIVMLCLLALIVLIMSVTAYNKTKEKGEEEAREIRSQLLAAAKEKLVGAMVAPSEANGH